jgi:hypothetical protein
VEEAAQAQSVTLFITSRPTGKTGGLTNPAAPKPPQPLPPAPPEPSATMPLKPPPLPAAAQSQPPAPTNPAEAKSVAPNPSASSAPMSTEHTQPMTPANSLAQDQASTFASSLSAPAEIAPPRNQQKCGTCGHLNRAGVLICENCGSSLVSATATIIGTKQLPKDGQTALELSPKLNTSEVHALLSAGADFFDENMILRMEIDGATTPILVYPKVETSLGRRDPAGGTMPDVDLTSYAAYRMGVSRRHALLLLKEKRLQIVDLGSSNGTMVNGVKLVPHQPRALRDGDQLSLGKMSLRLIFQASARR